MLPIARYGRMPYFQTSAYRIRYSVVRQFGCLRAVCDGRYLAGDLWRWLSWTAEWVAVTAWRNDTVLAGGTSPWLPLAYSVKSVPALQDRCSRL